VPNPTALDKTPNTASIFCYRPTIPLEVYFCFADQSLLSSHSTRFFPSFLASILILNIILKNWGMSRTTHLSVTSISFMTRGKNFKQDFHLRQYFGPWTTFYRKTCFV
jgi:hypothetical protein